MLCCINYLNLNLIVKISNGCLLGPVTKYNKNYACKRIK